MLMVELPKFRPEMWVRQSETALREVNETQCFCSLLFFIGYSPLFSIFRKSYRMTSFSDVCLAFPSFC